MYRRAGIDNVQDFYEDKFVSDASSDFTGDPLNFYDINYYKLLWLYSQVLAGASVLDFGCGSGALACLKHKGCRLVGVDYSRKALQIAKEVNGYDQVFCGNILEFNTRRRFDYVVSLDVFGHIPFEEKDATIAKLKSLLKRGGVMLHGIECGQVDYAGMSAAELEQFVSVDGHVGIEGKPENLARFSRYFRHVEGVLRYDIANSADEYLKQSTLYHAGIDPYLLDYLESLDPAQKRAFNIGAGLTQIRREQLAVPDIGEGGGFLLLRASDRPLPAWEFCFATEEHAAPAENLLEDQRIFASGWYPVERVGDLVFRWTQRDAIISLPEQGPLQVELDIFSNYPRIHGKSVDVYIVTCDHGELLAQCTLASPGPVTITFPVDSRMRRFKVFPDVVFIPKLLMPIDDSREIGIGVSGIRIAKLTTADH